MQTDENAQPKTKTEFADGKFECRIGLYINCMIQHSTGENFHSAVRDRKKRRQWRTATRMHIAAVFFIDNANLNPSIPIKGHVRCPGARKLVKSANA